MRLNRALQLIAAGLFVVAALIVFGLFRGPSVQGLALLGFACWAGSGAL